MGNNGLARVRIIKSTLETTWYRNLIDREFNVIESFNNCVKISNPKDLPENVSYYILNGDFVVIGKSKGRRKNENNWNSWNNKIHHGLCGFRINNRRKKPIYV